MFPYMAKRTLQVIKLRVSTWGNSHEKEMNLDTDLNQLKMDHRTKSKHKTIKLLGENTDGLEHDKDFSGTMPKA